MTTEKWMIKQAQRKNGILKDTNNFQRNHKNVIPAYFENVRYTGACKHTNCNICKGVTATLGELVNAV